MAFKEIKNISVKKGSDGGHAPNMDFKKPNYDNQNIRELIGVFNLFAREDDAIFRENIIRWVNDGRHWRKYR